MTREESKPRRMRNSLNGSLFGVALWALAACQTESRTSEKPEGKLSPIVEPAPAPKKLYLPDDSSHQVDLSDSSAKTDFSQKVTSGCPIEMVSIRGQYCIDRFETSLVRSGTDEKLSPYYPPLQKKIRKLFNDYFRRHGTEATDYGRKLAVPFPPDFSLRESFQFTARSKEQSTPSGYLSRHDANAACREAGKRLCRVSEWQQACRGEAQRKFPYGDTYQQGACNVGRGSHPASLLHADSSRNHLDPRLNRTRDAQGPLLRKTGTSSLCKSEWGDDAIYDMVGNLDEWAAEEDGQFLGGFYSRATREGCDSQITVHGPGYRDYSLGTRCCSDL